MATDRQHDSSTARAPRGALLGLLEALARLLARVPRWGGPVLASLWYALIFRLSANPGAGEPGPLGNHWFLNTGHAVLFGLLALWLLLALPRDGAWPRLAGPGPWIVVGLTIVLAALDEWHQSRVPGRSPALTDVLTDAVGALSVLWIVAYAARSRAEELGARARFLVCLAACAAAGALATLADLRAVG